MKHTTTPLLLAASLPAIQAGVLLISSHGTADTVVPYEDNTAHLVKLWQDNGGRLKLFPKEGADHHPHGPCVSISMVAAGSRATKSKGPRGWKTI